MAYQVYGIVQLMTSSRAEFGEFYTETVHQEKCENTKYTYYSLPGAAIGCQRITSVNIYNCEIVVKAKYTENMP